MIDPSRTVFPDSAIEALVHSFYARVRQDELLAPVFADRITDWDLHLARMTLFWRSVLLGEAGYRPDRGSPRALHQQLGGVTYEHYDRWLDLFGRTAREVFEPAEARLVLTRAERMAVHLSAHLGRSPAPAASTR